MSRKKPRRSKIEKFVRRLWRKYRRPIYSKYIDAACWWYSFWPRTKLIRLVYGIINLVRWLPLIWKDRDWDAWCYLLPMMEKKIQQLEDCERRFGHYMAGRKTKYIRQLQTCRLLIKRLRADDYLDLSWYSSVAEKWMDAEIMYKPLKNAEVAHKHETAQRDQDLDLLFKIMRKHIREWWN